mgnify:FL=1
MRKEVRDFVEELNYTRSKNTAHVYEEHLRKFFRWLKSQELELELDEVSFRDIREFRNSLCDEGLSPRSINAIISALRAFFKFLKEEGIVEDNPVKSGRLRLKEPDLPPNYMDDNEIDIVFSFIRKNFPKNVVLAFETMLNTALRVSEAAELKGEHVITLQNRVFLKVEKGKGSAKRTVPVTDPKLAFKLLKAARNCENTLFKVKSETLQFYAYKIKKETGINFHTHRLRHTAATKMLSRGVPIDVVQVVLGHSSINMTRRYAHTLPESLFKIAAEIPFLK